jgi:exodeoxyribonuclease VII large subunit
MGTYLTTAFKDKDQVKALGARWDAERRSWFVPDEQDLTPFATWLPAGASSAAREVEVGKSSPQGISLSQLLTGVSQAVAAAYRSGVWTRVEVVKVDARRGHVYLELTERSQDGGSLAQARATIWADTANAIVPQFEQATGAVLGPGIKLLVRARPTVHPQYGLSLAIDGIDPEYTLGDLEARKREIRERLKREGLFDVNRQLPAPWDINAVLVVAPPGAAGLGDFEAEARRLEQFAVCRFVYAYSRFQGEGAPAEIRSTLMEGLDNWRSPDHRPPDAVAIIRGGGAVNDLAWLNDYALARCICELDVPVLTGIGHERDNTILDEVAHQRFDTPSKVIAGIEQRIRQRANEAQATFEAIARTTEQQLQGARRTLDRSLTGIRSNAQQAVNLAERHVDQDMANVRLQALGQLGLSSQRSAEALGTVKAGTQQVLARARAAVEGHIATVRLEGAQTLTEARASAGMSLATVLQQAGHAASTARTAIDRGIADVASLAKKALETARDRAEALMREVAGQGPEKTLSRGFAVVRAADGRTLTRAGDLAPDQPIEMQFSDGRVGAITQKNRGTP